MIKILNRKFAKIILLIALLIYLSQIDINNLIQAFIEGYNSARK